jgi:hypothetical protein
MIEDELSTLAERLQSLTAPLTTAINEADAEKLLPLLEDYDRIVARIRQIASIDKSAVKNCPKLLEVARCEADLLTRAIQCKSNLENELGTARQNLAVNDAYNSE